MRKYTWGLDLAGTGGQSRDREGADAGHGGPALQGAGGIGGLLAVDQAAIDYPDPDPDIPAGQYLYSYDANGNVGQLVAWASDFGGATGYDWHADRLVAHYEYDPYGNIVNQTGAYAEENPIRFSTKHFDDETGLGSWIFRYYSPRLGRFPSRDPAGEPGAVLVRMAVAPRGFIPRGPVGEHPYAYAVNSPIDWIDPDGWSAQKGGKPTKPQPKPSTTRPGEKAAGRGATCGLKIKRSAICTLFPKQSCDYGHEWIEGGGGRWDFPKDYGDDPCHEWDRNHPVWEWNAHVKLFGGKLPHGTPCGQATCNQIQTCLQQQEDEWEKLRQSREKPYDFLFRSCINFVDAALNNCCMARGALPTRTPRPFEEARLCCERCEEMERLGCNRRFKGGTP